MSATTDILDFASAEHTLPQEARADTLRLLADTLAVGSAGARSREASKLETAMTWLGADGAARLIGGGTASPTSAAFANGFAIHCLEWDAVHEAAVVHALSVVAAALLAKADADDGCDPDDFLTALAVGVDIASGLGIAATGPMAFFRPATAGIIGAALAVARLGGIERGDFAIVAGFAYSFAGGTMQAHLEASSALPLQIANAARGAVTAVALTEAGLDAPRNFLEGAFGYARIVEPLDLALYTEGLGRKWLISEVATKPFPSGRASHGALGTLETLYDEGLRIGDVQSIELFAPPLISRLVERPATPEMTAGYARLCLPFLAALILREGSVDPRHFEDTTLHDTELLAFADCMTITCDDNSDGNALGPQRLVVSKRDGTIIERAIRANLGSTSHPMNCRQTDRKLDLCRQLAGHGVDSRIFDDPLAYATVPK